MSPTYKTCESSIDHTWGAGGPGNGLGVDFSARWTGIWGLRDGQTTFTATSDDGIRLWVDGVLIINAWVDQAPTTYQVDVFMTAGLHTVKVEYYVNAPGMPELRRAGFNRQPSS